MARSDVVSDNLSMYADLHSNLENKVRTSKRLIDKLTNRAKSVESTIAATEGSLAQLEDALRSKDAPLQMVNWRREQREKRPIREQVRDVVEVALEEERSSLVNQQHRLKDQIKKTKRMIVSLEHKLDELRHDLGEKHQALGIDETCLRSTQRSWQVMSDRSPVTSASLSGRISSETAKRGTMPHQAALHESSRNEVARQQQAVRLGYAASRREETSMELIEENRKVIARCQREASDMLARTERAMQSRIDENQNMRKRLMNEVQATSTKINHTKGSIDDTRSQIKSLEEPIALGTTCASWRRQRATGEHIKDPVSAKLYQQQSMLLRHAEDLKAHHQNERTHLQDLHERKHQLKEDLTDKTSALHIDLHCLTHESNHTPGRDSMRRQRTSHSESPKYPNYNNTWSPNGRSTGRPGSRTRMPLSAR